MPTDFSRQFKREAFFKKKVENCSWSKHLPPGSALREVVRALEFFAKKYPDRYIFASPKALVKSINVRKGSYRKGRWAGEPLSLSTVEKALAFLRQLGILSPTLQHAPEGDQHTPGWVLAPHDDCCSTYPQRCEFIGARKKGVWISDVWVRHALVDIEIVGDEPGAVIVTEPTPQTEDEQ